MADERILAPAEAYYAMAEILNDPAVTAHLGINWFLKPQPDEGVSVQVIGRDRVVTTWAMEVHFWQTMIFPRVANHPDIRVVSASKYKNNRDIKGG